MFTVSKRYKICIINNMAEHSRTGRKLLEILYHSTVQQCDSLMRSNENFYPSMPHIKVSTIALIVNKGFKHVEEKKKFDFCFM